MCWPPPLILQSGERESQVTRKVQLYLGLELNTASFDYPKVSAARHMTSAK